MAKDYYEILGVNKTATDADIKRAFRTLAHKYHPDKGEGNTDKFKEINEAYQILSNKEKRDQYDRFGTTFDQAQGSGGFSWQDGFAGGANPFGGFGFGNGQQFDFGDLGDIFGDMFHFGDQDSAAQGRNRRGSNIEIQVPITFKESYFGTEKEVSVSLNAACDTCKATGNDPQATVSTCKVCKGNGRVTSVRSTFLGSIRTTAICPECKGQGSIADKKCPDCHGSTIIRKQQTIKVSIPAGIAENQTIRLQGKGDAGAFGGGHGDAYIKVAIAPDSKFKRDGYDIKSTEEIPLSVLANGGSAYVDSPSGISKLKVPSGTKSGTTFVLRGKGFDRLTGRGKGDHLITVEAMVPGRLTSRQKKLLDEFESSLK